MKRKSKIPARPAGGQNPKSKLTEEEVRHVAKLARLELSEKEVKRHQEELSGILDYVEILNKINTKEVGPTSQVTELKDVFRQDKVKLSLTTKEALSGTRAVYKNSFKIKAIFE